MCSLKCFASVSENFVCITLDPLPFCYSSDLYGEKKTKSFDNNTKGKLQFHPVSRSSVEEISQKLNSEKVIKTNVQIN